MPRGIASSSLDLPAEWEYARPDSSPSGPAGADSVPPRPADTVPVEMPVVAIDPGTRPRLGELSSYIVERCGSWWGMMGWLFFLL